MKNELTNEEKLVEIKVYWLKKKSMINDENANKLNELEIFKDKVAFEFHDGWTDLLYKLGKDITELCELTNYELPKMLQIKTKLGTLRFYYDDSNLNYPDAVKNSIFALLELKQYLYSHHRSKEHKYLLIPNQNKSVHIVLWDTLIR